MSFIAKKGLAPATIAIIILALASLVMAAILIARLQGADIPGLL